MTVTPSDLTSIEADLDLAAEAAVDDFDLAIPEEVPTADDPGSRASRRDLDGVGFTLDEFASLLSKYDYNFKPGDVVNGTVFALEAKGAMIDIGAKTAAFMPPAGGVDQPGRGPQRRAGARRGARILHPQ